MSRTLNNNWPVTKNAEFYKLFAERTVELTDARSHDGYRVHALSTIMKLRELSVVCGRVLDRHIPKVSLEHIVDEVTEALQSDLVARHILSELKLEASILLPDTSESTEEIQSRSQLARSLLEEKYQEVCEELIISQCQVGGSKYDLLVLCKLYVSHLCGTGFHKRFIYETSMDSFYRSDIARCSQHLLLRFFDNFKATKLSKYTVVLSCTDRYSDFLKGHFGVSVHEDPAGLKEKLGIVAPPEFGQGQRKRIISIKGIEARDRYSVISQIEGIFEISRSFMFIFPSNLKDELDDECLVYENKEKEGKKASRRSVLSVQNGQSPSLGRPDRLIKRFRDFAFADRRGRISTNDPLFRALSAAALAGDSSNPETQIITLWSAFEALLPPPTKDEKSPARIVHFNSLVVPALVAEYLSSKFAAFFRDLDSKERKAIRGVLNDTVEGSEHVERLARVLACDDNTTKKLFQIVAQSPLRVNRLYNLYNLAQDPRLTLKKVKSNEARVSWQIHRIYRERNQIVHSGDSSPFLIPLVENSFFYFRVLSTRLEAIYTRYGIVNPHGALQLLRGNYIEQNRVLGSLGDSRSSKSIEQRRKESVDLIFN